MDIGQEDDCIWTFDEVPHKLLLIEIKSYSLDDRVMHWMQDFLYNRTQQVEGNGVVDLCVDY